MSAEVIWSSSPPCTCDVCGDVIMDEFVDGKTKMGMWACMCPACATKQGTGLGSGRGQRYQQRGEDWVKVEG